MIRLVMRLWIWLYAYLIVIVFGMRLWIRLYAHFSVVVFRMWLRIWLYAYFTVIRLGIRQDTYFAGIVRPRWTATSTPVSRATPSSYAVMASWMPRMPGKCAWDVVITLSLRQLWRRKHALVLHVKRLYRCCAGRASGLQETENMRV